MSLLMRVGIDAEMGFGHGRSMAENCIFEVKETARSGFKWWIWGLCCSLVEGNSFCFSLKSVREKVHPVSLVDQ